MSEQKKLELDVRGMTCPSCAHHVENALKKVEGVEKANVPGWQSNEAVVSLSSDIDEQELLNAVQLAGYKASLKEQKSSSLCCSSSISMKSIIIIPPILRQRSW